MPFENWQTTIRGNPPSPDHQVDPIVWTEGMQALTAGVKRACATVSDLLLDISMTYSNVSEGWILQASYWRYRVAPSSADPVAIDPVNGYHRITLGGVKLYVLTMADGSQNIKAWGASYNGTNDGTFSEALQAIVDACGNPEDIANPNPTRIVISDGVFVPTTNAFINAKDGLFFDFGRFAHSKIVIPANFVAGAVPATFPDDGLDYSGPAFATFSRLRHTGKTSAFINPGAAAGAGAAWYYKFSGVFVDATAYGSGKDFDFIRAPEIANLHVEDLVMYGGQHILNTDDDKGGYASTFARVQMWYGHRPLKVERGTTYLIDQCSATHCDHGWGTGVDYSVYNAPSVDHWGVGQYAYDIKGRGVVLNAPGCEYGKGGIFRARGEGTEITINGGYLLGGAKVGDSNYTGQVDETDFGVSVGEMIVVEGGARVTFGRTPMRNIKEPTPGTIEHMKCRVIDGGRAVFIGNTGEAHNENVQRHDWEVIGDGGGATAAFNRSRIDWVGDTAQFQLFTTEDETILKDGWRQITFTNPDLEIDLGPSHFDTLRGLTPRGGSTITAYTMAMPGILNATFGCFVKDMTAGDNIYFVVTDHGTNRPLVVASSPISATGVPVTLTGKFFLNANDTVKIFYRSSAGATVDPVILPGASFHGEICN